jgi:hypothetical protein
MPRNSWLQQNGFTHRTPAKFGSPQKQLPKVFHVQADADEHHGATQREPLLRIRAKVAGEFLSLV